MRDFIKGMVIGIANIIPGVSGGTLAVILGIYDKLITSISTFLTDTANRKRNFLFLTKIGLGAIIGVAGFSHILTYLIEVHPTPTYTFFVGLIIGTVPIILKGHPNMKVSPTRFISFAIGATLISLMSPSTTTGTEVSSTALILSDIPTTLYFLSGLIAAAAMIVPGVSGSFMLLILGTYGYILNAVKTLHIPTIAIVGLGAISGILVFSKLISLSLKKHPSLTYYFIIGLLIGSIPKLFPGIPTQLSSFALSVLALILGAGLVQLPNNSK